MKIGRPSFFDDAKLKELDKFIVHDKRTCRLPWEDVRDEMGFNCGVRTVKKAAHKLGFHKRSPQKKPGLRPKSRPKRLQWAIEYLSWTYDDWCRIVWTDESQFSTSGFSRRPPVTCRDGDEEAFHENCIDEQWRQGRKSQMVWAAFCGEHKSDLHFVPGKVSIDSTQYTTTVLDPLLIPFWHRMCEIYGWTALMEDNAPGHKKFAIT